eukprot:gene10570-6835_t
MCDGFDGEVNGATEQMPRQGQAPEELRRAEKTQRWQREMFAEEDAELERKLEATQNKVAGLIDDWDD